MAFSSGTRSALKIGGFLAAAVICAAAGWWWWRGGAWEERTYVIGFEDSHPAQWRGPDGQPTGVVIDVIREAARRREVPRSR